MSKHKNPVPIPNGFSLKPFTRQDIKDIKVEKGKYLSPEIVDVGDLVLTVFTVAKITHIKQVNYLPRFVLRDKNGKKFICGKTKLRGKLAEVAIDGD